MQSIYSIITEGSDSLNAASKMIPRKYLAPFINYYGLLVSLTFLTKLTKHLHAALRIFSSELN